MLDGTLNVLEMAGILNLKRVIYLSSIAIYTAAEYEPMDEDHPVHKSDQAPSLATYSSSKLASESVGMTYWGLYGLPIHRIRLSAVYGFGMRYPIYVKPMVENSLIGRRPAMAVDKGGDMKGDYTYVEDVVAGTLLALDCTKPLEHRIFNLSTGLPLVKASEAAKVVRECLPDSSIESVGSGLSELEETEVKRGQLSIEKARKELGLEPGYPITEGHQGLHPGLQAVSERFFRRLRHGRAVCGWMGKILKVDLTSSDIVELDTMDYADRFLGGRGIATRLYWEEVTPEAGALEPENRLILMTGPMGATGVQGASRFEVVGKSPMILPEGFCYGNLGGYFAPFLKKAGYDGVVVSGRADRPSYILVTDGKAEIRDAASLIGKSVSEVRERLQAEHGQKVHFVTTGLAGENLCRNATLMTEEGEGSATGGFGAVLGRRTSRPSPLWEPEGLAWQGRRNSPTQPAQHKDERARHLGCPRPRS